MRSSVVVGLCSMLALAALTALGLNVPSEPLVRSEPTRTTAEVAPASRPEGSVGPLAPSVPALSLRSAAAAPVAAVAAAPVRVRVPAIEIDAPVVRVGVDTAGSLDVPDPRQVGWYEHGPTPGATGAAVLAAHVDLDRVAGVFYHLDDVLPGDRIYIDFDDGSTQRFEVVDDVLYDKTALPESELFRRSGDPALHLVTCGGEFDPAKHHYLGNRVVTARLLD